jgi:wyosine [tRNA(Phe)-imidazoG37] synthetase (radical SAM superfamily)
MTRYPDQEPFQDIVFGPVRTLLAGPALGINPTPARGVTCGPVCEFCERIGGELGLTSDNPKQTDRPEGCLYRTFEAAENVPVVARANQHPSAGIIVTSAARKIIELSKAGEKLKSLIVAGGVEPTTHPNFLEITENVRDLRNKWFAKASLVLLTDGSGLDSPEARHSILIYDRPVVRIDWGTAKLFTAMTKEKGTVLKERTDRLVGMEKLVVQTVFVQGKLDNTTATEIRAWIKRIEEIRPREVVLRTIPKVKRGQSPKPVAMSVLEKISAELADKTGIEATILDLEAQPA